MHVSHVVYERRVSDGNYGNRMISMSAILTEEDDPESVVEALRMSTLNLLAQEDRREREEEERESASRHLDYEMENKKREIELLRKKGDRMIAFLKDHGVEIRGVGSMDDIPF